MLIYENDVDTFGKTLNRHKIDFFFTFKSVEKKYNLTQSEFNVSELGNCWREVWLELAQMTQNWFRLALGCRYRHVVVVQLD